ncbi:protein translocase subunit SecF [Flexistipes sp.]|uniref:protein translocase subunit SecF n=1 Tax=Flexistipes sp. TaxID=3088135 RepID=UPI002E1F561A|nr:protein translocase subunit SecF [Flexistipes sp.]
MFEVIKHNTKIDFLSFSKKFLLISAVVVIASLGIIFVKGFNYGIDFAGGTLVQARFDNAPDLTKIRTSMEKLDIGEVVIQNFGNEKEVLIRVEKTSKDLQKVSDSIQNSLTQTFEKGSFKIVRVEQVGPQVGAQLKNKATMAVLYALIGILIYISLRFEFTYSLAAVIALFHDVLITLGIFSLAGMEINLPIIAAVLTIVGYSLNDTIVVFDRIRETIKASGGKKVSLKELMNKSINQTLSRTLLTSFTTLLAVLSLYLFGGEVIHGFAFALLIGIIIGTYSSIGVASSLVFFYKEYKGQNKETG